MSLDISSYGLSMELPVGPLWFPRWVWQHQIKPTEKYLWEHCSQSALLLAPPGAARASCTFLFERHWRNLKGPSLLWAESRGCGSVLESPWVFQARCPGARRWWVRSWVGAAEPMQGPVLLPGAGEEKETQQNSSSMPATEAAGSVRSDSSETAGLLPRHGLEVSLG